MNKWGQNKSPFYVNMVEEWLERVLSGREMNTEANTIQINLFSLEQRELFVKKILPFIWNSKHVDCFVQEHQRQEFDYRITVLKNDETIPAISVPCRRIEKS